MGRPRGKHQVKHTFPQRTVEFEGDIYRYVDRPGRCGVCGNTTRHKSVYAAEHCCSRECSRQIWYDIFENILSNWMSNRRSKRS
jgi:hypothetical protein